MGINIQRFEIVKQTPGFAIAQVLQAAISLQNEAMLEHILNKENLEDKVLADALAYQLQTLEDPKNLTLTLNLIKKIQMRDNEANYQFFLKSNRSQFFDAAMAALDLRAIKFLIEDLKLDINGIESQTGDNTLHKICTKTHAC